MPKNLLVIEDDKDLVEILNEILVDQDYNVKYLTETNDIGQLVEDSLPDLVLLDYLLPGINGGELCAQIKSNEKTSHIPVIIFSAYPRVMLSLGDYGCDAFISKPFDLNDLLSQINTFINQSSTMQKTNEL